MKLRNYIIIAVCSYLFFALDSTPAAKIISLAKNNFDLPAQFYGVQGSIWNGQAESIVAQDSRIDAVQWTINPAALLLAHISADIQGQIKQQDVAGHVSLNMSGNIHVEDLRTTLSANEVQNMLAMPFGELGGEFNLNIKSLYWTDEGLPEAIATIEWRNAKLTLADTVDLGKVTLDIKPDEKDGLSININNITGMISINGKIQLSSNKQYNLQIDFKPSSNANTNIKQSLAMFAKRQSNGSYRFKQTGNLKQLGL